MEPNEELRDELIESTEISVSDEPTAVPAPEPLPGGRYNLDICPNCLEPNDDDLAVCRYCGQPLNPNAEAADASAMPEDAKTLEANRTAAVSEKKGEDKKKESGFRRVMPWLGLYLIYYAITGCFDIKRQIKAAEEAGEAVNSTLAYFSQVIWFAAGVMMAWPLIKQGWHKIHPVPEKPKNTSSAEEPSEEAAAEPETGDNDSAEAEDFGDTTDDEPVSEQDPETGILPDDTLPEDIDE